VKFSKLGAACFLGGVPAQPGQAGTYKRHLKGWFAGGERTARKAGE
jgi:hypothetical protein